MRHRWRVVECDLSFHDADLSRTVVNSLGRYVDIHSTQSRAYMTTSQQTTHESASCPLYRWQRSCSLVSRAPQQNLSLLHARWLRFRQLRSTTAMHGEYAISCFDSRDIVGTGFVANLCTYHQKKILARKKGNQDHWDAPTSHIQSISNGKNSFTTSRACLSQQRWWDSRFRGIYMSDQC